MRERRPWMPQDAVLLAATKQSYAPQRLAPVDVVSLRHRVQLDRVADAADSP